MKYRITNLLIAIFVSIYCQAQTTTFEQSEGKQSATYQQAIDYYKQLCAKYPTLKMEETGSTDTYYPLHVVYYSNDEHFDRLRWKKQGKIILLINNGIHPGEPDGIDACMMMLRDAASGKIKIPDNVALAVIPVFNIGGALNRNSYSRANQNGPEAYGFRGSAQNLDLNRDFIKLDAKATRSLVALFHKLDPEIFIDNHVSDGADYQHVMTLLATQHNKLGGTLGKYMDKTFVPMVYADMKKKGYDLVPYVNDFNSTPDHGWTEFYDLPRFSSGFAAMWQTMAFVPETHMLKPYKQRVIATYDLMCSFIKLVSQHADVIQEVRMKDREAMFKKTTFTLNWKPDTSRYTMTPFKGYAAEYKKSEVSGLPRLYYDRSKPFTKEVPFYNYFIPTQKVTAPKAYIIKQGWDDVIDRLKRNEVAMQQLDRDTTLELSVYHIEKYETVQHPYEKHYLHKDVQVQKTTEKIKLIKGDYIIPTDQLARRYLVETLEPTAPDAFFAWNFFDAVLQEKEYFSDYVFEETAAKLLQKDTSLQRMLDEKRRTDAAFAKDGAAQLEFIYKHSPYAEPEYMRYPVFRLE
ncbi:MAG: M14 family metallopeptidase [Flavipsychrobacter sp.]